MTAPDAGPSWFVKRDLDGFFGLFVDNLVQILLIVGLCGLCGIGADSPLLLGAILPGVAVSLLVGNVFYAWQAHRLMVRTGRGDVTALPYGINTPSLLVYIFFVMLPVYQRTGDETLAWKLGLVACFGSGLIELSGALFAGWVRRKTPRAALLSTLAGIAIGFISMTFTLQIFNRPLVALLPLGIILIAYFALSRFPLGLPGGLVAVLVGTACAWLFPLLLPERLAGPAMSTGAITAAWETRGLYLPQFFGRELWELLADPEQWLAFLGVIIPMGLFNLIGSLQNLESAEASGDTFHTGASLSVNGVGTILAACFGSCFPTTIYIGHPGWKALGARAGYSTLNGIVITLFCLTGTVTLLSALIPLEAGVAIVLWIGVVITSQAFRSVPERHAGAVAVGLFPAIAAWGQTVMAGVFALPAVAGSSAPTMQKLLEESPGLEVNGFLMHGLITLERGYIFTCMILAAVAACLVDRKFVAAAVWSFLAALLTGLGLMHAYQLSGSTLDYLFRFQAGSEGALLFRADGIAAGYLLLSGLFLLFAQTSQSGEADRPARPDTSDDND